MKSLISCGKVVPSGNMISLGLYILSASYISLRLSLLVMRCQITSPVDTSENTSIHASFTIQNNDKKLLDLASLPFSVITVPGVMTFTTSRLTMPLTALGSSNCSQIATL